MNVKIMNQINTKIEFFRIDSYKKNQLIHILNNRNIAITKVNIGLKIIFLKTQLHLL